MSDWVDGDQIDGIGNCLRISVGNILRSRRFPIRGERLGRKTIALVNGFNRERWGWRGRLSFLSQKGARDEGY